jgi:hypothetical protein
VLIHVLDQGRRTGRCMGLAGEKPFSGFVEIRQPKEERPIGHKNIMAFLRDTWARRLPDLVVSEAPMTVAAWFQSNKKKQFPTSPAGVESGFELHGCISGMCGLYGITHEVVRRETVLKFVTGRGRWANAEEGKLKTIEACIRMGLVEATCTDEDRCDAVAMFVYASAIFGRKPVGDFRLFA